MAHSRGFLSLISAIAVFALMGHGTLTPSLPAAVTDEVKVLICHNAGPRKQIEIEVSENAVDAHVTQHGDTIGSCEGDGGGDT